MANFVKEDGIYRCRLQIDGDNRACIAVIEHFAWDRENKRLDESKPQGGLQVVLRAEAYRVEDDGSLGSERMELNMENFGVTIITKAEFGEEVRSEEIARFVRIFGLADAGELLTIDKVNQEQLLNASFDCRVWTNSKGYKNYVIAPVGESNGAPRKGFAAPSANRATLDKYRQKLRIECAGIKGATPSAETPKKAVSAPPKAMPAPQPKVASLPPRSAAPEVTLNDVWEKWIAAYPEDTLGATFYGKVAEMFGQKDATDLTSEELAKFVKAQIPSAIDEDDIAANLPF